MLNIQELHVLKSN